MPAHYYYDTAEGVERWLDMWEEELLKEPEEIILGRTLRNVLSLINTELQGLSPEKRARGKIERSEGGQALWAREMMQLLDQEFRDDAQGMIAMLRRHHPNETDALGQLLRAGVFDIAAVETAIDTLLSADWWELLFDELRTELSRGSGYDEARLHVVSYMLLEMALPKFSDSDLKQLPRRTFIREYTALLLAKHADEVLASATIRPLFDSAVTWVLAESRLSLNAGGVAASSDLFGLYETFLWKGLAYELLRSVADALRDALIRITSMQDGESGETDTAANGSLLRQLSQFVLDRFVRALYRHSLYSFLRDQLKSDQPTPLTVFAAQLLDTVAQACHWGDVRREQDEGRSPGPFRDAVQMSLPGVLAKVLSESARATPSALEATRLGQPLRLVAEWLASEMEAALNMSNHGPSAANQQQLAKLGEELATNRHFQEKLWSLLKPLAVALAEEPSAAQEVLLRPAGAVSAVGFAQFWTRWQAVFPEYAESFQVFHYLPWNLVTESHISHMCAALAEHLRSPRQDWWVFFRVQGLSIEDARYSIGQVHLYDPGSFDYGEGQPFYSHMRASENILGIRVDISAPSSHDAQTRARSWAEEALDVLSFALSKDQDGIDPVILPKSLVMPQGSPDRWSSDEFAQPSQGVGPGKKVQEASMRIVELYGALLSGRQTGSPVPTDLQAAFVRALRWYRKGRWKDDPDERFLLHWIALEHFFAQGKETAKESTLLEVVPRAYTTWRSALQDFWPMWVVEWGAAVTAIRGCPELLARVSADPELAEWDRYYYILFGSDRMSKLEAHARAAGPSAQEGIQGWVDSVRQLDTEAVRGRVIQLREMCSYRLHLMWARRNALVHEARAFGSAADMEIYAQELQKILEIVLRNMAVEATSPSSMCRTIDDLIDLANLPWPAA
jgi:hypothetical protein